MWVRPKPRVGRELLKFNELARKGDVEALTARLDDERYRSKALRAGLASALGATHARAAREPLAGLLKDPEEHQDVRLMAARALGELGDRAAVPALLEALGERSVPMHVRITVSLGQIGGPEAVDALLHHLTSDSATVRSHAAEGLGRCRAPVAQGQLISALSDDSRKVRVFAAEALAALGDATALQALQEAAEREGRFTRGLIFRAADRLRTRIQAADSAGST